MRAHRFPLGVFSTSLGPEGVNKEILAMPVVTIVTFVGTAEASPVIKARARVVSNKYLIKLLLCKRTSLSVHNVRNVYNENKTQKFLRFIKFIRFIK